MTFLNTKSVLYITASSVDSTYRTQETRPADVKMVYFIPRKRETRDGVSDLNATRSRAHSGDRDPDLKGADNYPCDPEHDQPLLISTGKSGASYQEGEETKGKPTSDLLTSAPVCPTTRLQPLAATR